jgi:hypothetical protein
MIWALKLKEVTKVIYIKLKHNCTLVEMYTNGLIKVKKYP